MQRIAIGQSWRLQVGLPSPAKPAPGAGFPPCCALCKSGYPLAGVRIKNKDAIRHFSPQASVGSTPTTTSPPTARERVEGEEVEPESHSDAMSKSPQSNPSAGPGTARSDFSRTKWSPVSVRLLQMVWVGMHARLERRNSYRIPSITIERFSEQVAPPLHSFRPSLKAFGPQADALGIFRVIRPNDGEGDVEQLPVAQVSRHAPSHRQKKASERTLGCSGPPARYGSRRRRTAAPAPTGRGTSVHRGPGQSDGPSVDGVV